MLGKAQRRLKLNPAGALARSEPDNVTVPLRLIRLAGCSQGQGYLFSRPLPVEELQRFVAPSLAEDQLHLRSASTQ
jgi:predicted signal transduction protein with EAL and GGDEF domain